MFSPVVRIGARSLSRGVTVAPRSALSAHLPLAARLASVRSIVSLCQILVLFIILALWLNNYSPAAKRYTEEHEWVSLDSETSLATISITKHASASLGDVVFVELPAEGKEIAAGG